MEPVCEFCGVVRAVVYCKSDSAKLCLRCDTCVHSANYLSRRHSRSLICDKCNSQPAIARCMDEKMSLCQSCDWNGNGCSGPGHSRQPLRCYSGCPSLAEFSRIWSSVLDVPPSNGGFEQGFGPPGTLPINDNCFLSPCLENTSNEGSVGLVTSELNCDKFEPWIGPSTVIPPSPNFLPLCSKDQTLTFPKGSNLPKGHSSYKNLEINDGEDLCEGLNMDDVELNFESCDEIFDSSRGQSTYNFDGEGTNCQLMEKNASVTESNGHVESAIEAASSTGKQECMAFQSSRVVGSANLMQTMSGGLNGMLINPSCNSNINLSFPTGQVHSSISLSLSNITGESSVADYQDCGLSPVFLTGESPWESNLEVSCPQARDKAKMRYNEKKKTRMFGKQIRYASRKARADTRKRVKGRFVKAGEAYDYDPLVTRNF
ncbi:unnamed protein product [Camellia sinensis]|uniref:CCT domain-containing protein n=1 Tax=Camellia sinensis var. sinensis TaxID=542762 RepID=A0A4S4ETX8_CAMSN|nr:putative zinc finger protein CONSTANS-LIKE 11 [Camellia sinensis]THG20361.1 hypothetical protein TEA_026659 [Camellia sinensis var. sinensis]